MANGGEPDDGDDGEQSRDSLHLSQAVQGMPQHKERYSTKRLEEGPQREHLS